MLNNIAALVGVPSAAVGVYESIATTTLASSQTTISFTSISSSYKHLQLRVFARCTSGDFPNTPMQLNNDSGANYRAHYLGGNGSVAFSGDMGASQTSGNIGWMPGSTQSASVFGISIVDILDYANTNKYKTVRSLNGGDSNGSGLLGVWSSLWMSTSAINRLDITAGSGQFTQYSSFALYGIK
jgi:hypothetical protein